MALLQPANDDATFIRKLQMDFNLEMSLIRAMLVLSLSLQLALVISGYFRKMTNRFLVTILSLSYLCYLAAEPTATTALAMILRAKPTPLALLWTTFLLWHLGGPYNLTAYAVQDSETWTRQLLFFLMRLGTVLYLLQTGKPEQLSCPRCHCCFDALLAGTIKYAERIWALWTATTAQLVSRIYFGHQDAKWRDEEGLRRFLERPGGEDWKFLRRAYSSFMASRLSFLGLADNHLHILLEAAIKDETHTHTHTTIDPSRAAQAAFRLVGIQLELLHDTLYTKFPMPTIKYWRLSTNVIYLLTLIASLLIFSTIAHNHNYEPTDIFITYLLLSGTILLECVSITMQVFSTWSMVYLDEGLINHLPPLKKRLQWLVTPRRHVYMGQHDLLQQCFKQRQSPLMKKALAQTNGSCVATILNAKSIINRFYHSKLVIIHDSLTKYIYSYVTDSRNKDSLKYLLQQHQSLVAVSVFQHQQLHFTEQAGMDFIDFIVQFHIMTNVLYHTQTPSHCDPCKAAKHISDYMMYLVLVHPLMLPKGLTGDVIYKQLMMEVNHNESYSGQTIADFSRQLYNNPTQPSLPEAEDKQKDKAQYSMLLQTGGLLLQELQRQLLPPNSPHISTSSLDQQAWDTIRKMWTDMLAYGAVYCGWKEHVNQLKDGGELLTYVALLMLQLGFHRKTPL